MGEREGLGLCVVVGVKERPRSYVGVNVMWKENRSAGGRGIVSVFFPY